MQEKYHEERKLQKLMYWTFAISGIVAALAFQTYWIRILFSALMSAFSFSLLHTVYLGIKYSSVELTTGIYSKTVNPGKYYFSLLIFTVSGLAFIYKAFAG